MIKFDIIAIFPEIFDGFLRESIIKRAQQRGLIKINLRALQDYASDKHKSVDDKPFGGGRGMVVKPEPVFKAVASLTELKAKSKKLKASNPKTKIILFTPRGKKFNQKLAYQLSKLKQIIMICGRYEGVDERVAKHIADLELSIGDYVLMGGEVPAMAVIEAVARLIPGVLGKSELLSERMTKMKGRAGRGFIEYPQYTRPVVFEPKKGMRWSVPKVLVSGNHKKIEEWRKNHSRIID
jgi:tRNA (guanine37-N1)-methyltransferase